MTTGDFEKLGEMLAERRRKLGLTPDRVHALGGPSVVTLRKMERGEPTRRRLDTTFPLEQIYGWSPGSIDGYLDYGTLPHVVREPAAEQPALADIPTEVLEAELRRRAQEPPVQAAARTKSQRGVR